MAAGSSEPARIVGRVPEQHGGSSDAPGPVEEARPGRDEPGERSQSALEARPRRTRGEPLDEAMLRTLYEEHWQVVLNYAARLLLQDHHGAADVTQEVFLRAWRHAEVFTQGPGYTRAWLLTVARNLIVDRHRARGARAPEVSDAALRTGSGPAAPDHADWVAASVTVATALTQLSPDHLEVLREVYWRGRSAKEAADAIGISVGTVKSRTHYAIRRLREALGAGGVGR